MDELLTQIQDYYLFAARFLIPLICIYLLLSCARRLFASGKNQTIARLVMQDSAVDFDITSQESAIGRSAICDIRLNLLSVSRRHAVLTYNEKFGFKISAVGNAEIMVNDIPVDGYAYIQNGDVVELGGVKFCLTAVQDITSGGRSAPRRSKGAVFEAVMLTLFQLLAFFEIALHYQTELPVSVAAAFGLLMIGEWIYFGIRRFRGNIQIEILGLFLTTFGMLVAASAAPSSTMKLLLCAVIGVGLLSGFCFIFRDIELTMKLRYFVAGATILLLVVNLIFGENLNGARNWIRLGSVISFQPSELIKFAFIFVGAATLERLLTAKNIVLFLGFSCCCIGALFLMRDFGTASIYFVTMLIICYMRSGDIRPILVILAVAVVGAVVIINVMPYVTNRFAAYRHVWEMAADQGYQQTRTMIAIASGGLFGLGGGNGNLYKVAAADTDLVFGFVCEEWGMIAAFCICACFIILAIYAFKCTRRTGSAYYAIAACAAAGLFIFQASLNIFGSTDLLPLTGVTIPFVSNGGSSMIASWALLSFIKAIGQQTGQNASAPSAARGTRTGRARA